MYRPYLAAVVIKLDGDKVHYFHPALRKKKEYVINVKFVKPFQPQIQEDWSIFIDESLEGEEKDCC